MSNYLNIKASGKRNEGKRERTRERVIVKNVHTNRQGKGKEIPLIPQYRMHQPKDTNEEEQ